MRTFLIAFVVAETALCSLPRSCIEFEETSELIHRTTAMHSALIYSSARRSEEMEIVKVRRDALAASLEYLPPGGLHSPESITELSQIVEPTLDEIMDAALSRGLEEVTPAVVAYITAHHRMFGHMVRDLLAGFIKKQDEKMAALALAARTHAEKAAFYEARLEALISQRDALISRCLEEIEARGDDSLLPEWERYLLLSVSF